MCGIIAVLGRPGARSVPSAADVVEPLAAAAAAHIERDLDAGRLDVSDPAAVERLNAALVRLRDVTWAVRSDRLRTAQGVADLAGEAAPVAADGYWAIQVALSALDRLE